MTDDYPRARLRAARGALCRLEFHGLVLLLLAMDSFGNALILPTLPLMQTMMPGFAPTWLFSSLVLGFGATQLLWGTLADHHGRRKVLLGGLALLTCASSACLVAVDAWQLITLRFAQGAGIAAAGVCAHAMIRDRYAGEQSVSVLSRYFSGLGLVGLAGPYCAGHLIDRHGYQGALVAYAVLAALAWVLVLGRLPRGAPSPRPARAARGGMATVRDWQRIVVHPVFGMYTALTACSYLGHFIFLTQSAFLFMDRLHWSVVDYGAVLSLCSVAYVGGTLCCRNLLRALGVQKLVAWASVLGLAGAGAMLAATLLESSNGWLVAGPYFCFVFAHAIHQSCGQAAVMAPFQHGAAQASGLAGTILSFFAVLAERLVVPGMGNATLVAPLGIFLAAGLTATLAWTWIRSKGDIASYGR